MAERSWKQDPDAVRADILKAALAEFAERGLSGARVQAIAERTKSSKRMIFYYFGDKEGLYRAVLAEAYAGVRRRDEALDLAGLAPDAALERLVAFTFDHHRAHPEFIRLVGIENTHRARHMAQIPELTRMNRAAIRQIEAILSDGVERGVFRPDVTALELHWQISALCCFNVANRPTFSAAFGEALFEDEAQRRLREQAVRSVLSTVRRA